MMNDIPEDLFKDIPKKSPPHIWLAHLLGVDPDHINQTTSMATEPQWDSIVHVQVMLYLEQRHGIVIDGDTIQRYRDFISIKDICEKSNP